jgi:hypothetical protein
VKRSIDRRNDPIYGKKAAGAWGKAITHDPDVRPRRQEEVLGPERGVAIIARATHLDHDEAEASNHSSRG